MHARTVAPVYMLLSDERVCTLANIVMSVPRRYGECCTFKRHTPVVYLEVAKIQHKAQIQVLSRKRKYKHKYLSHKSKSNAKHLILKSKHKAKYLISVLKHSPRPSTSPSTNITVFRLTMPNAKYNEVQTEIRSVGY